MVLRLQKEAAKFDDWSAVLFNQALLVGLTAKGRSGQLSVLLAAPLLLLVLHQGPVDRIIGLLPIVKNVKRGIACSSRVSLRISSSFV